VDEIGRARERGAVSLTKKKEEQHPRSHQNPSNVQPATDHMIHQSTNSDHVQNVIEFITAVKHWKKELNGHKKRCNKKVKYKKAK